MKRKYYGWAEHTAGKAVKNDPTEMWGTEIEAENEDEACSLVAKQFEEYVRLWEKAHPNVTLWDSWWVSQTTIASRTPYPDYTPDPEY